MCWQPPPESQTHPLTCMYSHVSLQSLGHTEPFPTLHTFEGSVAVSGVIPGVGHQRVRSGE